MTTAQDGWIRANDFRVQWATVGQDVHDAVERSGASGWYILGKEVEAFEAELSTRVGGASVVGCASGLDALELALRALELPSGERVLTTPFSAFATTLAIVRAGGVPVFVDVDRSGCVDLDLAERAIEKHGIRWFVPVHLYGHPLSSSRLEALVARGVNVVEDCAQSLGAFSEGRPAGSVGQIAATSFYPTKNLGALGDGGAAWTASSELAMKLRRLRDYGQEAKYQHSMLGLNSRLDEVHAAILRSALLPRLDGWLARRLAIATLYRERLENPRLEIVGPRAGTTPSGHLFPLLVEDPARFMAHLRDHRVESGRHYPGLIPDQRALEGTRFESLDELPVARRLAQHEVSIPLQPFLTDEEVDRVVAACNAYGEG